MEDLEARIIRLEENAWFQEKKLEELDRLARDLEKQVSANTRQLEQVRTMLLFLREALDARVQTAQNLEPPPPHYQQER